MGAAGRRPAAVVVDYDVGQPLADCVTSLRAEGVSAVVVVENGRPDPARTTLQRAGLDVPVLVPGSNLGYGAGANRGVAALADDAPVLICNADVQVHRGALARLVAALEDDPAAAIVGPRILTPAGERYPSARRFPSLVDAAGHAALGLVRPHNRFTVRYREGEPEARPGDRGLRATDWVSGACFMVRRSAFEELGGFDESYFMFAEDTDLCWRAHRQGWGVAIVPEAVVTHVQGLSTDRHPYAMLVAHHRSAWRFARRSTTGWRRLVLPGAAVVLLGRLVANVTLRAARGSAPR